MKKQTDNIERQIAFKRAILSFKKRLGVDYMDLSNNTEAQTIAYRNLNKETIRLRTKYMNDLEE
jgi:hypothetical protein